MRASRVENVFHGTASGVDVAACADGGVIWFERSSPPRIERLCPAKPLDLVVALSGEKRSTAGPVGRLRQRHAQRPELYGRLFGSRATWLARGEPPSSKATSRRSAR